MKMKNKKRSPLADLYQRRDEINNDLNRLQPYEGVQSCEPNAPGQVSVRDCRQMLRNELWDVEATIQALGGKI